MLHYVPQQSSQPTSIPLLTAIFTVIATAIVGVLGQIAKSWFIGPIKDQKKAIGEIADKLIFYGNALNPNIGLPSLYIFEGNKGKELLEKERRAKVISQKIRRLGTKLVAKTYVIPLYSSLSRVGLVLPMENIMISNSALIGLSNSIGRNEYELQNEFIIEIRKQLHLLDPNKKYVPPSKHKL